MWTTSYEFLAVVIQCIHAAVERGLPSHAGAITFKMAQRDLYLDQKQEYRSIKIEPDDITGCPKGCNCKFQYNSLSVWKCLTDPTDELPKLFTSYPNTTVLFIGASNLSEVPCSISLLPKLKRLKLPRNHIKDMPGVNECIAMKNHSLMTIDLSLNKFTRLRNGSFYDYQSLQNIFLESNHISEIESDVFLQVNRLPNLRKINLSGNKMRTIDSWPLTLMRERNLVCVFLFEDTPISKFTNNLEIPQTTCETIRDHGILHLTNTNITHLTDLFTGWNINMSHAQDIKQCFATVHSHRPYFFPLHMSGNPLACDCVDYDIYAAIHTLNVTNLRCRTPRMFKNQNPLEIPLEKFICDIPESEGCPHNCDCIKTPHYRNISLSCSSYQQRELPRSIPALPNQDYSYCLDFSNSKVGIFNKRPYLEQAIEVYFTHSLLREISLDALLSLQNVRILHLDNNYLKRLPDGINAVELNASVDIRLGNNPWVCDCHAVQMKDWIVKLWGRVSDTYLIICDSPSKWKGNNMVEMDRSLLCQAPDKLNTTFIIIITVSAAMIILCITLCIICGVKHRVWIYKKTKWHLLQKDECENEGKSFDVFVSYSNEDEDYVAGSLIPALEERGFKVCFHRVHFYAGKSIIENICEAINKSKRMLVYFSRNFSQSDYGMYEFSVAMGQDLKNSTRRLVCIKGRDLDINELDAAPMTYFHSWGTYIDQDDPNFWDNLLYVLPVHRLGAAVVDIEPEV